MQTAHLPIELKQAIADAQQNLKAHHNIEPTQRQAIYVAMGSWQRGSIGHHRRACLAINSAKRVLPLMERLVPGSCSRALLLLAQQILEGRQDATDASLLLMQRWRVWLDEDTDAVSEVLRLYRPIGSKLGAEEALNTVDQVARAAKQALEVALWDETDAGQLIRLNPGTTLEYWRSNDTACWAWLAEREQDGVEKCLTHGDTFWKWWLCEAAPSAWFSI